MTAWRRCPWGRDGYGVMSGALYHHWTAAVLSKKVCSGIPGKRSEDFFFAVLSFFLCVPKRRNKKKAPQPVLALRASLASRRWRDAEKLGLRPQTVGVFAYLPRLFPPRLRGAAGQMGENSHWHAAEHRRGCRKGDLHCLSAASLQSPGSIEEYPMRGINSGHPAKGGTRDTGCLFFAASLLVHFFGASKEMNILITCRIPLMNQKKRPEPLSGVRPFYI